MQPLDEKAFFTGTQVNYFIVCPSKLWYFSHYLQMEQTSDLVSLGKLLHETTYERIKKDVLIDSKISIDFVKKGDKIILHEIKKSKKLEKAHFYQTLYYLYYLKNVKNIPNVEGILNYPKLRKTEKIKLTNQREEEIENILKKIEEIISKQKPPKPEKKGYCRKCSYFEFCFS
jgi:CRISPR-associated exonuclease Cas4